MSGYQSVRDAAEGMDIIRSSNGHKFMAQCPAHEDKKASLSAAEGDEGRALLHCFAGCSIEEIVSALGLEIKDLFGEGDGKPREVAQYVYTDEDGAPLFRVIRYQPKSFTQERWDDAAGMWKARLLETRRVLYNLPEVVNTDKVWIAEGEKDVEMLRAEGVVATTVPGGANGWKDDFIATLKGKTVNIIADNDKPGIESAMRVKNALRGACKGLDVWISPVGKDVTDLLMMGKGLGDLERYVITDGSEFDEMEWDEWEPEEVEWLLPNYIPAASRVLAFGPAGSMKSLWSMWVGSELSKSGHKVAYFSLEMPSREVAKRLRKFDPPRDNFKLFRRISFESQADLAAACDLFKGYSLIVIDSWSAVHGDTNNNDAVAKLDRSFFLPLIEETGATLLILDNTGQPVLTERGKLQPEWARGASAKGDKMDHTLMFNRPDELDNHKTTIKVKKVRGDGTMPKPVTVKTDPNIIDFRYVDEHGTDLGSMWGDDPPPAPEPKVPDAGVSLLDRLREARNAARLEQEREEA